MVLNAQRAPITPTRRRAMLDRALAKSQDQADRNNLPRILRRNPTETVWAVASRTEAGVIHLVVENYDGQLSCDCPADHVCWHTLHVSRALAGEIGHLESRAPRLSADLMDFDLTGRRVS